MTKIEKLPKILKTVLWFTAFIAVLVFLYFFVFTKYLAVRLEGAKKAEADSRQESIFKNITEPIYLQPLEVSFGDNVLNVESVGVEDDGTLSVPKSWSAAGWYKDGPKAGENGNVILDGHYDTSTGAPGAFWELKDLQVGDKVVLTDRLGRDFEYLVNSKFFISINDPQRAEVFEKSTNKILTLITCSGVWDYSSGTYNKRLVVTAVFDKMEKAW